MLLCLVAVNDAPPVIWPAADLSVALAALSVAVRALAGDARVTRLVVDLAVDDGDDWLSYRAPDGRDAATILSDMLRVDAPRVWQQWRAMSGAVVVEEARD